MGASTSLQPLSPPPSLSGAYGDELGPVHAAPRASCALCGMQIWTIFCCCFCFVFSHRAKPAASSNSNSNDAGGADEPDLEKMKQVFYVFLRPRINKNGFCNFLLVSVTSRNYCFYHFLHQWSATSIARINFITVSSLRWLLPPAVQHNLKRIHCRVTLYLRPSAARLSSVLWQERQTNEYPSMNRNQTGRLRDRKQVTSASPCKDFFPP